MVRTPGFHPEDPGSMPHAGDFFLSFNSDTYFQSSANSLSAAYNSFQHSVNKSKFKYDKETKLTQKPNRLELQVLTHLDKKENICVRCTLC